MTETIEYTTFNRGIGTMTVLASEKGAVDNIQEDSPVKVNGVAIPENTVLVGGQGIEHYFAPEDAERAAQVLQRQIEDSDNVIHVVKNFHETQGQASADDVIGEVTAAGYEQGVGVVFEAEINDMDIAEKIDLGYLDVSPSIARSLGGLDETMEARRVDEVEGFRDIAVVAQGQRGADVEIGPNPAVEALSRNAVEAFDDGEMDVLRVSEPSFNGWSESAWEAPSLADTFDGSMEDARNSATWIQGDGEDYSDLSLFIVDGDGAINTNALDSAWRLAPQTDGVGEEDLQRLRTMYEDYAVEANEAGAITDDEFDNIWQDRLDPDNDTQQDNDVLDVEDAFNVISEEYDLEPEEARNRITSSDEGGDGALAPREVRVISE